MNRHLAILFEDHHCLALAKPAGQFAQGEWAPPGEMSLETAVRAYLDPAAPHSVYLGIVHRLDRPTSGVLIWAKTIKAARRLSMQFQERRVAKEYWAIVRLPAQSATASANAIEFPNPAPSSPIECDLWIDWLFAPAPRASPVWLIPVRRAPARPSRERFSRHLGLCRRDAPG